METDDLIIAVGDEIDKDRNALPNDLFGACKRFLESRNLRVIDPAKCMVLERRESVPEEDGYYLGIHERIFRWVRKRDGCIDIDNLNAKGFVSFCPPDLAFGEFPCDAIFGPISLPTEAR